MLALLDSKTQNIDLLAEHAANCVEEAPGTIRRDAMELLVNDHTVDLLAQTLLPAIEHLLILSTLGT